MDSVSTRWVVTTLSRQNGRECCWSLLVALSLLMLPTALAHYPESNRQAIAIPPPLNPSKTRSRLQSEDLVVTVERFSAATDRINLAMIGDGYQVDELESRYQPAVRDSLDYFFTHPKAAPYPRYRAFFNVFRIDIITCDAASTITMQRLSWRLICQAL